MQIKATSEFSIDSCFALQRSYPHWKQPKRCLNKLNCEHLSLQFWLENVCAILWAVGRGLLWAAQLHLRTLSGQHESKGRAPRTVLPCAGGSVSMQGHVRRDPKVARRPGFLGFPVCCKKALSALLHLWMGWKWLPLCSPSFLHAL